jgi:hypothetical protein
VGTPWNSSPVPAPPGFSVIKTFVGTGGIARWKGTLPTWLAVFRDDPRIQFAGRLVARSTESQFALNRTRPSGNMAMWTGSGLDGDGALLKDTPARFVLVRADAPRARTVTLQLHAPGAPTPVHWKVTRDGKPVRQGRLAPTADALVRLPIPPCSTGSCGPVTWRMSASGTEVPTSFPVYGAPGPSRPLLIYVQAAAIR